MKRPGFLVVLAGAILLMGPALASAAFWDPDPTPTAVPVPTVAPQVTPTSPKPRPAKRLKPMPAVQSQTPTQMPDKKLAEVPTTAQTTTSTKPDVFSPDHMKGRWGVGKGNIYQVGAGFSARYWTSDDEAFDFVAAFYDRPNTGSTFSGVFTGSPNWAAGFGLGLRKDLSRPVEDVRVQGILNLEYSIFSQENHSLSFVQKNDYQNITLGLGAGFEAFVPFWRNISVEGKILLRVQESFASERTTYNPAYYTGPIVTGQDFNRLSVFWDTDPLTLLNLSVHFYF